MENFIKFINRLFFNLGGIFTLNFGLYKLTNGLFGFSIISFNDFLFLIVTVSLIMIVYIFNNTYKKSMILYHGINILVLNIIINISYSFINHNLDYLKNFSWLFYSFIGNTFIYIVLSFFIIRNNRLEANKINQKLKERNIKGGA